MRQGSREPWNICEVPIIRSRDRSQVERSKYHKFIIPVVIRQFRSFHSAAKVDFAPFYVLASVEPRFACPDENLFQYLSFEINIAILIAR